MKVALVHYWLIGMRGGEAVIEELCTLYPDADIFTLFYEPSRISSTISSHTVKTSWLNKFSFLRARYTNLFPLFPFFTEQFDLSAYDLVISSDTLSIKGVITRPDALHVCYCHTPPRYVWDLYHEYLNMAKLTGIKRLIAQIFLHKFRTWDAIAANRVDYFIANSQFVAKRIAKYYRRTSTVIFPPVSVERFSICTPSDYYLSFGQLVPYKRIDLLVEVFNEFPDKKLIIAGDGPMFKSLKRKAQSNIQFLGRIDNVKVAELLQGCRAFLFPGMEDFGITPIEAQACGRPVIAYGRGGAIETIKGVFYEDASVFETLTHTGLFFRNQTPSDIKNAIICFEEKIEKIINSNTIKKHANTFNRERFSTEIKTFLQVVLDEFVKKGPPIR